MNRFINAVLLVLMLNASIGAACFGMPQGSALAMSSSIAASSNSQQQEATLANEFRMWLAGQPEFTSKFDLIQARQTIKCIIESADEFTLSKIRNFNDFRLNIQFLGFDEKTADALASRFCTLYDDVIHPVQHIVADATAAVLSARATETGAEEKKESQEEARRMRVSNTPVPVPTTIGAPVGQGTVGSVARGEAPATALEKAQRRVRFLEILQEENAKRYLDLVRQYEQKLKAATRGDGRHIPEDVKVAVQKLEEEKKNLQAVCQQLETDNNLLVGSDPEHRRLNDALREKERLVSAAQERVATLNALLEKSREDLCDLEDDLGQMGEAKAYAEAQAQRFAAENEKLVVENQHLREQSFFDTCQKLQETVLIRERETKDAQLRAAKLHSELARTKDALDVSEQVAKRLQEESDRAIADRQKVAEENKRLARENEALTKRVAELSLAGKLCDEKEVAAKVEAAKKEAEAEAVQCPICLKNKKDRVFVCGHGVCHECLGLLEKNPDSSRANGGFRSIKCPDCRNWSYKGMIRNLFI